VERDVSAETRRNVARTSSAVVQSKETDWQVSLS
jgi:hypothetical protein